MGDHIGSHEGDLFLAKFRGNSDDWLDDERAGSNSSDGNRKRLRNKSLHNAKALALEDANATVVEVFPKLCRVRIDSGAEILCHYRRAQVIGANNTSDSRDRSPVAVGDRVKVQAEKALVESVCERRNFLSRPAPGQNRSSAKQKSSKPSHRDDQEDARKIHVLAANLDLVVIVASAGKPEFSAGLVDRYLVACQAAGIDALLCVNKIDLVGTEFAPIEKNWVHYSHLGVQIIEMSAKAGLGLTQLQEVISDKTVVFCGQSGVGKTSLLNSLTSKVIGKTREISEATSRGMHTTTSAIMLPADWIPAEFPVKTRWIDTPGVREFGLVGVSPEDLSRYFPEFSELPCTQQECLHIDEARCSAVGLLRYPSYRRIYESLIEDNEST